MLRSNNVNIEKFMAEMSRQLQFLERIGDDINELASDAKCEHVSQELMGKAERIYDEVRAIRYLIKKLDSEVADTDE